MRKQSLTPTQERKMGIAVSYFSGNYTYNTSRTETRTANNRKVSDTGITWTLSNGDPIVLNYRDKTATGVIKGYIGSFGSTHKYEFTATGFIDNGRIWYVYDGYGGEGAGAVPGNIPSSRRYFEIDQNTRHPIVNTKQRKYLYYNDGRVPRTYGTSSYVYPYTNNPTYTYQATVPASASITVTGLTISGTTVSISSSYSGRVLVSTDGSNYYYSSGTHLPVSLGTSSRTVYVAILSTSGSTLGLSNGSSYSRSTLDSKISTYNTNETKNNNANNAASSFDSLYNSISGNINSLTSSNLSSLQSYLNTISSNSSTSDSRYTTRKTKYDTLNNKKNALDAAITAFDNLNLNTTPNSTTAAEAKRQLDIILTNAGSSYEGYTSRLAKYNTYVANLSTTEQLSISVGSLRELHTNISGTMLPGKVSRYTDIHTRGTEVYNTTKSYIEENFRRNS